ncbi:MAG: hypothetical protein ABW178_13700 [Pseudoxanthomonas sp.]
MDAFSALVLRYPTAALLAVAACVLIGVLASRQRRSHLLGESAEMAHDHAEVVRGARDALERWIEALQPLADALHQGDRQALQAMRHAAPLHPPAELVAAVDQPRMPVHDAEAILRLIHLAQDVGALLAAPHDLLDQRRALSAFQHAALALLQGLTPAPSEADRTIPPALAMGA